jgi:hypothetical protein
MRQLFVIADRAKDTTSLSFATVGQGVTTGKKKIREETMAVYCTPLRVKTTKLQLPKLEKSREAQKQTLVATEFFNLIDRDKSGTLTRHELKSALEDYGFSEEEKETIFSLVDADGSGSVSLNEFCQGLSKTSIQIEGRTSKANAMESYHSIALSLNKTILAKIKGDKIGPGSFAQIFKFLVSYAIRHRLIAFDSNSCVYAAPKMSAVCEQDAQPNLNLRKRSVGCNTQYASMNPFDAKVLKALSPNASLDDSAHSPVQEDEDDVFGEPLDAPSSIFRVSTPGSMNENLTLIQRRRQKSEKMGVTIDPTLDAYKNDPVILESGRPYTSRSQTAASGWRRAGTGTSNPSKGVQAGVSSFARQRTAVGMARARTARTPQTKIVEFSVICVRVIAPVHVWK